MAPGSVFSLHSWSLDGTKTACIDRKVQELTWSGSWQDCARRLACPVLGDALCELGGRVKLLRSGETMFSGTVFARGQGSLEQTVSLTAYDRGIYLKRNETYLKARAQTPEGLAAQLCREFGIPCGSLARTGVRIDRNFLGVSLYRIIQTMYTLAAEQTGKQYQVRFRGDELEVVEKALGAESLRLIPGSNLLSCDSKESMEGLVTSVAVYNEEGRQVAAYDAPDGLRGLYGLMQQAIKASDKANPAGTARQLLADNGVRTTITARCLGSGKLITGNTVVVHEPVTGVDGLFWILSDSHTVRQGIYQTTVTLDFRNLMDRQEAGSVPAK